MRHLHSFGPDLGMSESFTPFCFCVSLQPHLLQTWRLTETRSSVTTVTLDFIIRFLSTAQYHISLFSHRWQREILKREMDHNERNTVEATEFSFFVKCDPSSDSYVSLRRERVPHVVIREWDEKDQESDVVKELERDNRSGEVPWRPSVVVVRKQE